MSLKLDWLGFRCVLGNSTFSPSETLLLINLSFLNLVMTFLRVPTLKV